MIKRSCKLRLAGEKVNALATAWGKIDEHNLKQLEEKYPKLFELINRKIEKIKSL